MNKCLFMGDEFVNVRTEKKGREAPRPFSKPRTNSWAVAGQTWVMI